VLEPRVMSGRIDQRDQSQLRDPRQPPKLGRIDDLLDAFRQRHIQLVGNPHQVTPGVQIRDLRQVVNRGHGARSRRA